MIDGSKDDKQAMDIFLEERKAKGIHLNPDQRETTLALRLHTVNLAHRLEVLCRTEYPELTILHEHLVSATGTISSYPFVSYRLQDFHDLVVANTEGTSFVGLNPYGIRSFVRVFELSPSKRYRFSKAVEFLSRLVSRMLTLM
jgi:hypothetical protein